MHNKSFTADAEATIVGGRNVGDEYFGVDPRMRFVDLDVLAVGPIARDVSADFDKYWDAEAVQSARTVIGAASAGSVRAMQERFASVRACAAAHQYAEAVKATRMVEALFANELELEWARVRLLSDPPRKIKDLARSADLVFSRLLDVLGEPARSVDIISPYFVPGRKGRRALVRLAQSGVALRILTNSLAATDVSLVYAGYASHRAPLLRSRARIFELKPDGHTEPRAARGPRLRPRRGGSVGGSRSASSLHAKTISMDGCRVFVGSLNLDPRSIELNTEMGLVIESAAFARDVAERVDDAVESSTYEVVLGRHGRMLEWIEPTAQGEIRHLREPRTGLLKRLTLRALAWLPIEWLL
jgi:putative cardiolipin synthase